MSLEPLTISRDLGLGGLLSRAWLGVYWVAVENLDRLIYSIEGTIITTIGTHYGDLITVP